MGVSYTVVQNHHLYFTNKKAAREAMSHNIWSISGVGRNCKELGLGLFAFVISFVGALHM